MAILSYHKAKDITTPGGKLCLFVLEAKITGTTCHFFPKMHRTIFPVEKAPQFHEMIPAHPNFCCKVNNLQAIVVGTATFNEAACTDCILLHEGRLPDDCIAKTRAEVLGWKRYKGTPVITVNNLRFLKKLPSFLSCSSLRYRVVHCRSTIN